MPVDPYRYMLNIYNTFLEKSWLSILKNRHNIDIDTLFRGRRQGRQPLNIYVYMWHINHVQSNRNWGPYHDQMPSVRRVGTCEFQCQPDWSHHLIGPVAHMQSCSGSFAVEVVWQLLGDYVKESCVWQASALSYFKLRKQNIALAPYTYYSNMLLPHLAQRVIPGKRVDIPVHIGYIDWNLELTKIYQNHSKLGGFEGLKLWSNPMRIAWAAHRHRSRRHPQRSHYLSHLGNSGYSKTTRA